MRLLIFGDVVARPGRKAVLHSLGELKKEFDPDVVILNAENIAGGFSVTQEIATEMFEAGVDLFTSGNHIFDKQDALSLLPKEPRVLRPANYPAETVGEGLFVGEIRGKRIAVFNLLGRVFMAPNVDDPFRKAKECVSQIPDDVLVRVLDFHTEATSEKYAMGWFLDGLVSAVVGTHTHVQTADERILPNGTAYITDLGMTGSYNGVIGMHKDDVIERFTKVPAKRAAHSKGNVWLCFVVIDVDEETGKAVSIHRHRREIQ
ncbi:MAG: TIGR00282 family metallophosphoesterase [Pyrinomonadaceae bacterium]